MYTNYIIYIIAVHFVESPYLSQQQMDLHKISD